jgi:hypothetical protein
MYGNTFLETLTAVGLAVDAILPLNVIMKASVCGRNT